MDLNLTQRQTLKTHVLTNTNTVPSGQPWTNSFAGQTIADVAAVGNGDAKATIAGWYNVLTSVAPTTDFIVWRDIDAASVRRSLTLGNMTPIDPVPTDTQLNVMIWMARASACQGKQINLQNLIIGQTTLPMKNSQFRSSMQDCLTNIPAGAGGALLSAGWAGVRDSSKFTATRGEQVLASGTGSSGSPADLGAGAEGQLTNGDIDAVLNS